MNNEHLLAWQPPVARDAVALDNKHGATLRYVLACAATMAINDSVDIDPALDKKAVLALLAERALSIARELVAEYTASTATIVPPGG